jgi:hypothetical protein
MNNDGLAVVRGRAFLRRWWIGVLGMSVAAVAPCFWHTHVEAGDLGSHVYNAWLAQLIGQGEAPGLYLARQWHNVLFDFALLGVAKVAGFLAAEKIVIAVAVLIFLWGAFALVAALSGRAPWLLLPCFAMLAYGYSFNMGFFNYYISIGLACWSLAIFIGGQRADWLMGLAFLPVVYLAHPIGFVFAAGTMAYVALQRALPGWWKAVVPVLVLVAIGVLHWMLATRVDWNVDWTKPGPFYALNGSDQLVLYGAQYSGLARVAVLFGVICFVADGVLRRPEGWAGWKPFRKPTEFYAVALVVTALLPENLQFTPESAWIGLLVSRLTTISAIFGLAVLGCMKPRKWHLAGFALVGIVFFLFWNEDQKYLNQVEGNVDALLWNLPYGTRVIPTLAAPPDWRIEFAGHLADRACIGHCFTYSNYEAPSGQFRVRARAGSRIARDSYSEAVNMEGGTYVFKAEDLPLVQVYQCERGHLLRVCLRELGVGDRARTFGLKGGNEEEEPEDDSTDKEE